MEMLREELPETAVISIGHRPGLERHHDRVLVLEASPEGAVLADPEGPGDGEPPQSTPPSGSDRKPSEASFFSGALRALLRRLGVEGRERVAEAVPPEVAAKGDASATPRQPRLG